jgi:hypothetical protein
MDFQIVLKSEPEIAIINPVVIAPETAFDIVEVNGLVICCALSAVSRSLSEF